MSRKRIIILAVIVLLAIAAIVYFFIDPEKYGIFPRCPILALTGFKCPGCGSQRVLHSLLNGDLRQAAHYNAFLLAAIPVIAIYLINDYTKLHSSRLDKVLNHPVTIGMLGVLTMAWWILRNIYNW
jgi:hypothetical protein